MSSVLTYWIQTPQTPSVAAKLSKAIGRHYLRVGGEFRKEEVDAQRPIFTQFTFDAGLTANTYNSPNTAVSGNGWATFLLGAMDNNSTSNTGWPRAFRSSTSSPRFSDTMCRTISRSTRG